MRVLVSFSGGKDSQAALIWAAKNFKKITVCFCDTGWEHEDSYKHVKAVCKQMGLRLTTLKSKKYFGMVDMAKQRKRFPSTKSRFCTQELKIIPFIDYVLDKVKDDFLVIEGIRADESTLRSRMKQDCQYFKYYFEPYKSNEITIELLRGRENLSYVQKVELEKAHERLALGFNDEKYYTYRKNDVIEYVNQFAAEIYRPHFHDTAMDVFAYIYEHDQSPNSLYFKGSRRWGVIPVLIQALMRSGRLERIKNTGSALWMLRKKRDQLSFLQVKYRGNTRGVLTQKQARKSILPRTYLGTWILSGIQP